TGAAGGSRPGGGAAGVSIAVRGGARARRALACRVRARRDLACRGRARRGRARGARARRALARRAGVADRVSVPDTRGLARVARATRSAGGGRVAQRVQGGADDGSGLGVDPAGQAVAAVALVDQCEGAFLEGSGLLLFQLLALECLGDLG